MNFIKTTFVSLVAGCASVMFSFSPMAQVISTGEIVSYNYEENYETTTQETCEQGVQGAQVDNAIINQSDIQKITYDQSSVSSVCENEDIVQRILCLCNEERIKNGVHAVSWNGQLASDAAIRAKEIITTWSHTRPDGTPYYTVDTALVYGENIAYFTNRPNIADVVVQAWMDSSGHRYNILDPKFNTIGVAAHTENGTVYFAQEFGL